MIQTTANGREFVRTPEACFDGLEGYNFAPHYAEVDGLRVHYVDEGPVDGETVLMLHGQPTWSYLYRKMIGPVGSAGYRVIAPDLVGMGKSDKPTDPNSHTFEQQVAWVSELLDTLGLESISLVCQDWGSAIGLRLAGDRPELFSRVFAANALMVRMGMAPFTIPRLTDRSTYPLDPNARLRNWGDFLGEAVPLIGKDMSDFFWAWVQFALTAPDFKPSQNVDTGGIVRLTPGEKAAYDAPFPEDIYRTGPRTFPSMFADIDEEQNAKAWDALGRFQRPFLTVCGESDPLVGTQRFQDILTGQVPGAKGQPHARIAAGHFIQENAGELLAQHLLNFLQANPLGE